MWMVQYDSSTILNRSFFDRIPRGTSIVTDIWHAYEFKIYFQFLSWSGKSESVAVAELEVRCNWDLRIVCRELCAKWSRLQFMGIKVLFHSSRVTMAYCAADKQKVQHCDKWNGWVKRNVVWHEIFLQVEYICFGN